MRRIWAGLWRSFIPRIEIELTALVSGISGRVNLRGLESRHVMSGRNKQTDHKTLEPHNKRSTCSQYTIHRNPLFVVLTIRGRRG